jgi:type II secretory pathway pseudopilin PulG
MNLWPPEPVEAASRRLGRAANRPNAGFTRDHRYRSGFPQRHAVLAYSLIEVLIAAGILLTGIAAAAMMAHTMFLQEEANGRVTRALNLQEQAATLWQLGLEPGDITNILPEKCVATDPPGADAVRLTFTTNANITVLGLNPVQSVGVSIQFHSATAADGTLVYQSNNVTVVRPSTQ